MFAVRLAVAKKVIVATMDLISYEAKPRRNAERTHRRENRDMPHIIWLVDGVKNVS